jgi:hypothetical protein
MRRLERGHHGDREDERRQRNGAGKAMAHRYTLHDCEPRGEQLVF